jgi:hypothetical protein
MEIFASLLQLGLLNSFTYKEECTNMRKVWLVLLLALFPAVLAGCHSKEPDVETKAPTGNFNNNAPEAKGAPAAPGPGDDVPKPGGGGLKKKIGG